MKYTWGFDIGSGVSAYHFGFEAFVYDTTNYLAKIIPDSFDGVYMRVDLSGRLYQANETAFTVSNPYSALSESDFEGKRCCVSLLGDGTLIRQWTFIIETACEYYGGIKCSCVDPVARYLDGDFPNTPSLSANFPSGEVHEEKDYRVPITLGTAFIPVAPFLFSGSRYYCLGKTGYTYTINKVRTPRNWDINKEWDNSYTYNQSDKSGEKIDVRAAQLIIADSDGDGVSDANGVWPKSGKILSALIQYSGPYSSITGCGSWISTVLQLFGVDSSFLNSASFSACDTARSGVVWGGGFYKAEDREALIASLLTNCDCFLSCESELKLNPFSKTPVETFSTVKKLSFSPARAGKSASDGMTVRFAWDGEPQDDLSGEAVVGLYGAQATVDNPSNEVFEYRFGYDNSNAQAFGILNAQKKLDQKYSVTFDHEISKITARATLIPGQVVTVFCQTAEGLKLYGDSKDVAVSEMHFQRDGNVGFSGTVYNHLEEFSDLTPAEISPASSTAGDFEFLSLTKLVQVSGINIFHYAAGASVPAPTSVDLTATLFGGLTEYLWQYWTGSAWSNLSGTNNQGTYALTYDNAAWGSAVSLRVRCLSGDYYGEITITKVTDGSDGNPGEPGATGDTGPTGPAGPGTASRGNWQTGVSYNGNVYMRDIVYYGSTPYICQSDHTSGSWATDLAAGKWAAFGAAYESIATGILLSDDVVINRSLAFSGGASYINVTGASGLIINSASGVKINAGADFIFYPADGNTARLIWRTWDSSLNGGAGGYLNYNIGADYSDSIMAIWTSSNESGSVRFGWIPEDTAGGISGQIRDLASFFVYTDGRLYLRQNSTSGLTLIDMDDGNFYLGASLNMRLEADEIRIDAAKMVGYNSNYPNIGSSTTSEKFGYAYFVYDIRCRDIFCDDISANGILLSGGGIVGATSISCADFTASGTVADFDMDSYGVIASATQIWLVAGGKEYHFAAAFFAPEDHISTNCGHYSYAWDNVYGDDFVNRAHFLFMDTWKNPMTGEIEELDDISLINAITGSGKYDESTGLMLIDDDSIPEQLLAKFKNDHVEWDDNGNVIQTQKKGDVIRDPDGYPFISLRTIISCLMGAARKHNSRLLTIEKLIGEK